MAENKSPRRLSNVLPVMAALLLVCVHGSRAPCNPPCQNGFCLGFHCLCPPFFHGRSCEIAATCTPPCKNGTCGIENRCHCQEEFVGERCEIEACKVPLSPRNGNMTCSDKHYDMHRRPQKTCTAECEKGYQFPNGENEVELVCPFRANEWRPRSGFPDCEAVCDPPCQNGGTCREGHQCVCLTGFEGERCENDICKVPPSPPNGNIICLNSTDDRIRKMCTAECKEGYQFPNGENEVLHVCDLRVKTWRPRYEFPDCKAVCNPPCQNGGTCGDGNQCVCPKGFEGERCENAIRCQDPGTPENGVRLSSHYPVDSRIRFSCNADYELKGAEEILCRANGQWEGELTTCDLPEYSQCGRGKEKVGVASGRPVTEPWPWMATLYVKESEEDKEKTFHCGGSLIHPHFVLTAGHCMYQMDGLREPSDITVKLGLVHVNDTEHVQQLEVRKVYVHHNFSLLTFDYDAALLELEEPVQYNPRLFPICLPPKDIPADSPFYKPQSKVWIASWMSAERRTMLDWISLRTSDVQEEVQLDILPRETCRESLEGDTRIFTDRMFCAGTGGAMNDTCQGDIGGPVLQRDLDEAGKRSWTQVGIVSWGLGCGLHRELGVYTHLHQLMPWIDETIRKVERGNS